MVKKSLFKKDDDGFQNQDFDKCPTCGSSFSVDDRGQRVCKQCGCVGESRAPTSFLEQSKYFSF